MKRFLITVAKLLGLAFPVVLGAVQIPELAYDLGPKSPAKITNVADLRTHADARSTFAEVTGHGDFDKAFIYKTHGQSYAYFPVKTYDGMLIVRSYEKPGKDDDAAWKRIDHWVGRLQPIKRMAFRRTISAVFRERFKVDIPADAFYLARDDTPALSGWQIAALIYAVLLFAALLYFFFIRPARKKIEQGYRG